jgi:hypothetical protein
MSSDRNPHRALELLKSSSGSLLALLNLELRPNLVVAKELACDAKVWDKTCEDSRFVYTHNSEESAKQYNSQHLSSHSVP